MDMGRPEVMILCQVIFIFGLIWGSVFVFLVVFLLVYLWVRRLAVIRTLRYIPCCTSTNSPNNGLVGDGTGLKVDTATKFHLDWTKCRLRHVHQHLLPARRQCPLEYHPSAVVDPQSLAKMMLGKSIPEYIFIKTAIAALQSIIPLSVLYVAWMLLVAPPDPKWMPLYSCLLIYASLEIVFFACVYLPRRHHLQKARTPIFVLLYRS